MATQKSRLINELKTKGAEALFTPEFTESIGKNFVERMRKGLRDGWFGDKEGDVIRLWRQKYPFSKSVGVFEIERDELEIWPEFTTMEQICSANCVKALGGQTAWKEKVRKRLREGKFSNDVEPLLSAALNPPPGAQDDSGSDSSSLPTFSMSKDITARSLEKRRYMTTRELRLVNEVENKGADALFHPEFVKTAEDEYNLRRGVREGWFGEHEKDILRILREISGKDAMPLLGLYEQEYDELHVWPKFKTKEEICSDACKQAMGGKELWEAKLMQRLDRCRFSSALQRELYDYLTKPEEVLFPWLGSRDYIRDALIVHGYSQLEDIEHLVQVSSALVAWKLDLLREDAEVLVKLYAAYKNSQ